MLKALWLLLIALFTTNGGGTDDGDDDTGSDDDSGSDDTDAGDDDQDDDDDDSGAGGNDSDLDSDALKKELKKARDQAARQRIERNQERDRASKLEEQSKAILKALGISEDNDDDPSVEAEKLRLENRRLRAQIDFSAAARAAGADEDLTWGYLLARGEIDALDPDSDGFAETLQASITKALEAKPSLAVKPRPPTRGGADLDSGDDTDKVKPEEMEMSDYMKWRAERDKE